MSETGTHTTLPESAWWLAMKQVSQIGPGRFRIMLERFGSVQDAWHASAQELHSALDARTAGEILIARDRLNVAELWERSTRGDVRVACWLDDDYPALLREIPAPPPVIYIRGQLQETDSVSVAIVGTRRATAYGRDVTYRIAYDLAQAGVTIVSGLALGVDGVAHRAALEAGGRTIAVLGSGIDVIYPGEHRDLARRISDQGAVISDYALGTKPDRFNFPPRNRIISGLALGVVVTEAPERSGALLTVNFAAEQGRDAFAVPGPVHASSSAGCLRIIREGATMVRNAEDILEDLHIRRISTPTEPVQTVLPLSSEDRHLLSLLTGQAQHIDDIAEKASRPVPEVSGQLMMLELQGLARSTGAGFYIRT